MPSKKRANSVLSSVGVNAPAPPTRVDNPDFGPAKTASEASSVLGLHMADPDYAFAGAGVADVDASAPAPTKKARLSRAKSKTVILPDVTSLNTVGPSASASASGPSVDDVPIAKATRASKTKAMSKSKKVKLEVLDDAGAVGLGPGASGLDGVGIDPKWLMPPPALPSVRTTRSKTQTLALTIGGGHGQSLYQLPPIDPGHGSHGGASAIRGHAPQIPFDTSEFTSHYPQARASGVSLTHHGQQFGIAPSPPPSQPDARLALAQIAARSHQRGQASVSQIWPGPPLVDWQHQLQGQQYQQAQQYLQQQRIQLQHAHYRQHNSGHGHTYSLPYAPDKPMDSLEHSMHNRIIELEYANGLLEGRVGQLESDLREAQRAAAKKKLFVNPHASPASARVGGAPPPPAHPLREFAIDVRAASSYAGVFGIVHIFTSALELERIADRGLLKFVSKTMQTFMAVETGIITRMRAAGPLKPKPKSKAEKEDPSVVYEDNKVDDSDAEDKLKALAPAPPPTRAEIDLALDRVRTWVLRQVRDAAAVAGPKVLQQWDVACMPFARLVARETGYTELGFWTHDPIMYAELGRRWEVWGKNAEGEANGTVPMELEMEVKERLQCTDACCQGRVATARDSAAPIDAFDAGEANLAEDAQSKDYLSVNEAGSTQSTQMTQPLGSHATMMTEHGGQGPMALDAILGAAPDAVHSPGPPMALTAAADAGDTADRPIITLGVRDVGDVKGAEDGMQQEAGKADRADDA